jgi:hypothetical protein
MSNVQTTNRDGNLGGATNIKPPCPMATTGEAFADETQIDLIGDFQGGNPGLALWDGSKEFVGSSIEHHGLVYIPAPLPTALLRVMKLPKRGRPHGSTRTFFWDICKLVKTFSGLDDKSVSLVSRIVLLSALVDAVPISPTLMIFGPDVARGKQLLALLGCLCRHSLSLAGVTPAGLSSLPSGMQSTYLISQPVIGKNLRALLDNASNRDLKIPFRRGVIDLFGVQVLHSDSLPAAGDPWSSHSIQIPMIPTGQGLPFLDLDSQHRITEEYQAKLLSFRRANLGAAHHLKFDLSKFAFPLQHLARCLAAATPDDPQLQAEVISLLKDEDEDMRNNRLVDSNCVAVEAVLVAAHGSAGGAIYISELALINQEILKGRGEEVESNPGMFGKQLKGLGFTAKRDKRGSKLLLTSATITHARRLARDLGVPEAENDGTEKRKPGETSKGR